MKGYYQSENGVLLPLPPQAQEAHPTRKDYAITDTDALIFTWIILLGCLLVALHP